MARYRLTTTERDLLETIAQQPPASPLQAPWLPRQQIQDAYKIKDYQMMRVEPPRGSPLGEHAHGVSSSKEEFERAIISFRYTYSINKTDLRIAKRNSYDIVAQNLAMMRSAMEHSILTLVFQGSGALTTTDLPDIYGMFDLGEDTDAALDDDAWDTATKPLVHVKAGFDDLQANNYFPPFTMILSRNLESGFLAQNNAAEAASHEEIANRSYLRGGGVYYYQNGTSAYGAGGYTIYPLQAAANDDGVWCMFTNSNGAGGSNFYLAEVTNGIEVRVGDELDENNNYTYNMEWRGTPVFRNATTSAASAEYIVFEPDVDLA